MDIKNIKNDVIFKARPTPVPYNYRASYKVSQICMILKKSAVRKGCSIMKLQIISMAMYTDCETERLLNFLYNNKENKMIIRYDPSIDQAVKFAIFEKLIYQQKNGLFKLKEDGRTFVDKIYKDKSLMIREKEVLEKISDRLTEDKIKELLELWRKGNADN